MVCAPTSRLDIVTNEPLPTSQAEDPADVGSQTSSLNLESFDIMSSDPGHPPDDAAQAFEEMDSSSSSDSSSESCLDEIVEQNAKQPEDGPQLPLAHGAEDGQEKHYQHRSSKVVHTLSLFGSSFLCGRQLSAEYRPCSMLLVVNVMMCQQCQKRQHGRINAQASQDLGSVVKRARRS